MRNTIRKFAIYFGTFFYIFLLCVGQLQASTICVDNTSDGSIPDPTFCDSNCTDGTHNCRLRDAITAANNTSGSTIIFNIPSSDSNCSSGVCVIYPGSSLPPINQAGAIIDGYSQPGAAANTNGPDLPDNAVLKIILDGIGAHNSDGLTLSAQGAGVKGLVIRNFNQAGIVINSSGSVIEGNFIGTDPTGTILQKNASIGVRLAGTSSANTIGGTSPSARNIISGSDNSDIWIESGSSFNQILGNYIGTDSTGLNVLGHTCFGIEVEGSSNSIGGTTSAARNVISGMSGCLNNGEGIIINGSNNVISGNYIGQNSTGTTALPNSYGVTVNDGSSNVIGGTTLGAGNIISGNNKNGIRFLSIGTGNLVQGNTIGLNKDGNALMSNGGDGISLLPGVGGNIVGPGNIISGSGGSGVWVESDNNTIQGNIIGTNPSGNTPFQNSGDGITIKNASNNLIGGSFSGEGNLISANNQNGIHIFGPSASSNQIEGNKIGTNLNGTASLGNVLDGLLIDNQSNNNIIGGATGTTPGGACTGACNVISGNQKHGLEFQGSGADGNIVKGNYIGSNRLGASALGNAIYGILISNGSSNNTIGGALSGERNLVSGNIANGIVLLGGGTSNNMIQGNFVGVDFTGHNNLGNGGMGIVINGPNNSVGGTATGAGNTIAFNGATGIEIDSGNGNSILSNSIFSNAGRGIFLSFGFANDDQATPTLSSAVSSSGTTNIQGNLVSDPNTTFRVEFFANDNCDPIGFGEGQVFMGFTNLTTDSSGNGTFSTSLPSANGSILTATATNLDFPSHINDSSAFSACLPITNSGGNNSGGSGGNNGGGANNGGGTSTGGGANNGGSTGTNGTNESSGGGGGCILNPLTENPYSPKILFVFLAVIPIWLTRKSLNE